MTRPAKPIPPDWRDSAADEFLKATTKARRHFDLQNPMGAQRVMREFIEKIRGYSEGDTRRLMQAADLLIIALEPKERCDRKCVVCRQELWREFHSGIVRCPSGHLEPPAR